VCYFFHYRPDFSWHLTGFKMIKIHVHASVLTALRAAFPKPPNSAHRALSKYVKTLELMLNESQYLGPDPFDVKFNMFSISLHDLANKGGRIGTDKKRVHSWLERTGHALVKAVELGNNITGRKSRVKFTSLVTLEDLYRLEAFKEKDPRTIDDIINSPDDVEEQWIKSNYPNIENLTRSQILDEYDITPVDLHSLREFVHWLSKATTTLDRRRRQTLLRQALLIYRVANYSEGVFLQRRKPSYFGRTYYEGVSVQNVHKMLRGAMLGDAWEYDITSAVMAWKLGYGMTLAQAANQEVKAMFPMTVLYLEDKQDLIKTIRAYVFNSSSNLDSDQQTKRIKRALTALGFGARKQTNGWCGADGQWQRPALANIFKDSDELSRFTCCHYVTAFMDEQKRLDKWIFNESRRQQPHLHKDPLLTTPSGRASKSKILAYLYQHAETHVMNVVRAELAQRDMQVLANIHDAIIVRQRLSADDRWLIEQKMRVGSGNQYWSLSERRVEGFN
jgi:hypothetical protein